MDYQRISVVVDTNVVMGGLINRAKSSGRLIELWRAGEIEVVVSPQIKNEYLDIMSKMRFGRPDAVRRRTQALDQLLRSDNCRTVNPIVRFDSVPEDKSDNKFLECAVTAGATYIVTQDRHLLELGEFAGIKILRASDFFKRLQSPTIH